MSTTTITSNDQLADNLKHATGAQTMAINGVGSGQPVSLVQKVLALGLDVPESIHAAAARHALVCQRIRETLPEPPAVTPDTLAADNWRDQLNAIVNTHVAQDVLQPQLQKATLASASQLLSTIRGERAAIGDALEGWLVDHFDEMAKVGVTNKKDTLERIERREAAWQQFQNVHASLLNLNGSGARNTFSGWEWWQYFTWDADSWNTLVDNTGPGFEPWGTKLESLLAQAKRYGGELHLARSIDEAHAEYQDVMRERGGPGSIEWRVGKVRSA